MPKIDHLIFVRRGFLRTVKRLSTWFVAVDMDLDTASEEALYKSPTLHVWLNQ